MKQLVCKACGGLDFIKQDEFFICKYCGSRYSQDENGFADNSDFTEKILRNARRAKQQEDWEETEKYYNIVEIHDPSNIEAIFYSSYGKMRLALTNSDSCKRKNALNAFQKCISLIPDSFNSENEFKNRDLIKEISNDLLAANKYNYTTVTNQSDDIYVQFQTILNAAFQKDTTEIATYLNNFGKEFIASLDKIAEKFSDKQTKIFYYNLALEHAESTLQNVKLIASQEFINIINKHNKLLNELDPSNKKPYNVNTYSSSKVEKPKEFTASCYIATSVYGSYDCPQVWTLRRYRDSVLALTWYGRSFIKIYYAISPTLVKWFGHTKWFKKFWKIRLDSMVKKLNGKGFENTPYEDTKI